MAQKSTSVWRCRALSDSSAQIPLTQRFSFGPSHAPATDPPWSGDAPDQGTCCGGGCLYVLAPALVIVTFGHAARLSA